MRRVNFRVLGLLVAILLISGIGIHFLHDHQVRRTAVSMLAEADRAEKADQPGKTAQSLSRYLTIRPQDNDVLARYGLLLARTGKRPEDLVRAIKSFEQVLRNDPNRKDIRT